MSTDPRIPAAFRGPSATRDPLHWCVFTTVSLLTWALGPAALVGFSAMGLVAYLRVVAAGRRDTRCLLRDTRLVLVYLSIVLALGVTATVRGW